MEVLQKLNTESFREAIIRCYENPGYRVLIVASSLNRYEVIAGVIRKQVEFELIDARYFESPITRSDINHCAYIHFANASFLQVLSRENVLHGLEYNEILYDELIGKEMSNKVLAPMLFPYTVTHENHIEHWDEGSEELNEFLDTFKITA